MRVCQVCIVRYCANQRYMCRYKAQQRAHGENNTSRELAGCREKREEEG
jgi:hypothetical protein